MIPSNLINRNAVATVKGARNIFYHAGTAMGLRRLQFLVRSTNLPACRFAEVLYFERKQLSGLTGQRVMTITFMRGYTDGRHFLQTKNP